MDTVALATEQWIDHGWGDAAPGMAAITSVMRAQRIFLARVDAALQPHGLTFARYEVLMLLHFSSRGTLPITAAGRRLQVHPTSVTSAVNRLESDGLVERSPNPRDGRGILVGLTARGRATALRATADVNRSVFRAPGLSRSRLTTLTSVLRELRADAGDLD